jgi:TRAP transporter TAXI family solute receptor
MKFKVFVISLLLIMLVAIPVSADVFVGGSASLGGSNFLIMSGWSNIMLKNTPHKIVVESTGGPQANVQLIENGDIQMGVVAQTVGTEAWNGTGWADKEYRRMRSMFPVHEAFFDGLTLRENNIESLYDLEGKSVSVGPKGGTPSVAVPRIFEALGIEVEFVYLAQGDSIRTLRDGQIDAVCFFGGYPRPAYQELSAAVPVRFLSLSDEDLETVTTTFPQYSTGVITADAYDYLDEDQVTLKDRYGYAVSKDVDEDVVYEIVKATWENIEEFRNVHSGLANLEPENINELNIPLHPGALRYYEEIGVDVVDRLKM